MAEKCLKCSLDKEKNNTNHWVQCDRCEGWTHQACTYLKDISKKVLKDIPYYCDVCAIELQYMDKENHELKDTISEMRTMMIQMKNDLVCVKAELSTTSAKVNELNTERMSSWMTSIYNEVTEIKREIIDIKKKEKSDEIKNKLEIVTSEIKNVVNNIDEKNKSTYASKLKTKKTLIVKSTVDGKTASENKKIILGNIKTPVEAVNETKDGHLTVRFTNKENLEAAKDELEKENKDVISVSETGKMKPKIKLTNVSKDDDDVIKSIKMKNVWIANLIKEEEDLTIKKVEESRNKKKLHYIIKCSPRIRKAIFDHGDKLYTKYENCNIYDSYQPYQCYKCQEFGHSAEKCTNKQACAYCGDDHKYDKCSKTQMKCINCEKKGIDSNHKSFDRQCCKVYIEEIAKMKNNTDHGFE